MFDQEKYPIREEWEDYYKTLEAIRRTGVVNMFGSGPYLQECFEELRNDKDLTSKIFCSWATNYNELAEKYGWRN